MQGFRRAAVHLALVALLLRAFLPAGWMPGASGEAPLVLCSVGTAHDTDSHAPAKPDNSADGACAFAAAGVALNPPDAAILTAPVLQAYRPQDQAVLPLPEWSRAYTRPAPRAPPSLI